MAITFKKILKQIYNSFLEPLIDDFIWFCSTAEQKKIAKNGLFLPAKNKRDFILKRRIQRKFYRNEDRESTDLTGPWAGEPGRTWHHQAETRLHNPESVKKAREELLASLRNLIKEDGNRYSVICEIGTGNGQLLKLISDEFPEIQKFIGLDLNPNQIKINQREFTSSKLEFKCMPHTTWLETDAPRIGGIIFLAIGTLQAFRQKEVESLFLQIRKSKLPSALIIEDTVAIDLNTVTQSQPRWFGCYYSHNYPHLLKSVGMRVLDIRLKNGSPDFPFYNDITVSASNEVVP